MSARFRWVAVRGLAIASLGLGVGLAGCGGGNHGAGTGSAGTSTGTAGQSGTTSGTATTAPPHPTLQIVSSLPLTGPAASQGQSIARGMQLAIAEQPDRDGSFVIDYDRPGLNDAGPDGSWNAAKVANNALRAATSGGTIAYLGDYATGASRLSSPILSGAGVPQISLGGPEPTSGGSGGAGEGGAAGAGRRSPADSTLLTLAPAAASQAAADLEALRSLSCTRVALPHGRDLDARELADELARAAPGDGIVPLGNEIVDPADRTRYAGYLSELTREHANCAVYSGTVAEGGVTVTSGLNRALTVGGKIIGSSGVCTAAWTNPAQGGVPTALHPLLYCTAPGPALAATPAGQRFLAAYRRAYHTAPDPAAAYGYEAMTLCLNAIAELGPAGDDRAAVLRTLLTEQAQDTPIGPVAFSPSGTLIGGTYTLYGVARDGSLVRATGR